MLEEKDLQMFKGVLKDTVRETVEGTLKDTIREIVEETVQSALEEVHIKLDRLEARMDSLEARMNSLETRMESLEARVETLETRMDKMEKNFEELKLRLTHVELLLENETNRNILFIADGHVDLNRKLNEAIKLGQDSLAHVERFEIRQLHFEFELAGIKERVERLEQRFYAERERIA